MNGLDCCFSYAKHIRMTSFIPNPKVFVLAIAVLGTTTAFAQEYRNVTDTPALNKKYASLSLEVAKLQSRLVEAQNKTAEYQKTTDQAKTDAANSAQTSVDKAQTAASGNTDDTRRAVKEAKMADKRARQAKKADEREKDNQKDITKLNDEIAKKQATLTSLQSQKAAILGVTPVVNNVVSDTTTPVNVTDSTSK